MSRENVEVVRRAHEAAEHGAWEAVLSMYSDDREWDDRDLRPEGAVHRGRRAMREELRMWQGAWRDYRWEVERIEGAGSAVVVVGRERGEGKTSGLLLDHRVRALEIAGLCE